MYTKLITFFFLFSLSHLTFAQDIVGTWQSVDDVTGAPKGQVEIIKEADGVVFQKVC